MIFPIRPTCHAGDGVKRYGDTGSWRAPTVDRPWRTCAYCGSMHPEDLLAAIEKGATLGGSDWKYGWPHKFYVEVPNLETPHHDVQIGERVRGFDEPCPSCCSPDGTRRPNLLVSESEACSCEGSFRRVERTPIMGKRETFRGKWYNAHLRDEGFDIEAMFCLTTTLEKHSGIAFKVEGSNVKYAAPYEGYQR